MYISNTFVLLFPPFTQEHANRQLDSDLMRFSTIIIYKQINIHQLNNLPSDAISPGLMIYIKHIIVELAK